MSLYSKQAPTAISSNMLGKRTFAQILAAQIVNQRPRLESEPQGSPIPATPKPPKCLIKMASRPILSRPSIAKAIKNAQIRKLI